MKRLKSLSIAVVFLLLVFLCGTVNAAALFNYPKFKAQTSTGAPMSGGLLYSYKPGTTTLKATYADRAMALANTNPVVLDSNGEATVYLSGNYKMILKNSAGVTQWTMDSIAGITPTAQAYEVDALDYGPGDFTQATIEAALTAIGTVNKVTLFIRPGTWVISSNADWSAYTNVSFKIVPGAVISHGAFTVNIPNLDAGVYQILIGTGLVTLSGNVKESYVEWFATNTTPGITDVTAAIKAALASGQNVHLLATIYAHTGGLVQSAAGQIVRGSNKKFTIVGGKGTVLKKLSGNLVGYEMASHNGTLSDITFDNNGLDGNAVKYSSHYMTVKNILCAGGGGADYASRFVSVNTSSFDQLDFTEDYVGDILSSGPDAILYSEFRNVILPGNPTGPHSMSLTNTQNVSFFNLTTEGPIIINEGCFNIGFYNFASENVLTNKHLVEINSATATNIRFYGGQVTQSLGDRTVSMFEIVSARNITFESFHIIDLLSTAPIIFGLDTTKLFTAKNFTMYLANTSEFIKCNSGGGGNVSPVIDNIYPIDGSMTSYARWLTATNLSVSNTSLYNTFYSHPAGGRITMINVSGNINTANINAGSLVTLIGCDSITDANNLAAIISNTTENLEAAGAISIGTTVTNISTTTGAAAFTLANGRMVGFIKNIYMNADGGDATLTVTEHKTSSSAVFTFNTVNTALTLMWTGQYWVTIDNKGVTAP